MALDRWKLIYHYELEDWELFDLATDLSELHLPFT